MNIGISTACFYPQLIEDSLKNALELGFKELEIFFNCEAELEMPFVRQLKSMVDAYGARVVSVHPYTAAFEGMIVFTDYIRRFEEGRRFYRKYASAASYLGANMIVIHGDKSRVLSDEAYFERFHELDVICRQHGARLAQENVNVFRSQDPAFIAKMRRYLGKEVGFTFDLKQCIRAGCSPYDMLDAMGENIIHVHINDNDENHTCMLPGTGRTDYTALKKRLDSFGYSGSWILEVYSKDFTDRSQLRKSADFLEHLLP